MSVYTKSKAVPSAQDAVGHRALMILGMFVAVQRTPCFQARQTERVEP
jgi:hypothetical protein